MKVAIVIRPEADGQFVAHCPSLPGCIARAATRESAQHKMRNAVAGYLASMDAPWSLDAIIIEAQEASR